MRVIHFVCGCAVLFCPLTMGQTNPVPFINQPLVPMTAAPGGPNFTLTVNGTGFVASSVVNWNGSPLATTFVNQSQVTATAPASDIASPGTASVTVMNPLPGGGNSNVQYLGISSSVSTLTFSNYDFSSGTDASVPSLVAADFNGDGVLDLTTLGNSGNGFCIRLGNGDGSFQSPTCYTAGGGTIYPHFLAADFNGDGKLDVVVPDSNKKVFVFLGNGDGTFQAPNSYAVGGTPIMAVAGDFNGDGKLDLAVGCMGPVSILLGNGDGTFQAHVDYNLPAVGGNLLAVGDFNGDGKLDLAIDAQESVNQSQVFLLLGNGDGMFHNGAGAVASLFGSPDILAAVVNGDGKLDLVAVNVEDIVNPPGEVDVLLGNGDGTFQAPAPYSTGGTGALGVAIGDFNADGKLDLAAPNEFSNTVGILLGNGDGTFQSAIEVPIPTTPGAFGPYVVAAGDFNGDGRADLAALGIPNVFGDDLAVLLQGDFPALAMSPQSLNFPQQAIGTTSAAQTVTLTNTGNTTMTLSNIGVTGTNAGDFAQTNNCGSSLAINANCAVNVTFTPTANGTRTAALSITNNGPGSPNGVNLTGATPPGITISLSPRAISFPNQYVGTSGLPQSVTVTNTGALAVSLTNVAASPGDFGVLNACGSTLAVGNSCSIGVFFDPTTSGTRNGTLTITDSATGSPQTVSLSGSGQDFSLAASGSSSATVSPGQTASYTISVSPGGGFNQSVGLTCTGAPTDSTCSLSSSSITLDGSSAESVTVTVKTAGTSASLPHRLRSNELALGWSLSFFCGMVLLGTSGGRRSRRSRLALSLVGLLCVLSVAIMWSGCGGGSSSTNNGGGTPTGNYSVTVSGTFTSGSTTLTHNTKLTLVVQ